MIVQYNNTSSGEGIQNTVLLEKINLADWQIWRVYHQITCIWWNYTVVYNH